MAKLTTRSNVTVYLLELSAEEASALRNVTGSIIGNPTTSRRGLIDAIFDVLENAGVGRGPNDLEGSLEFKAPPGAK